jgi:hypothetical protein
MRIAFGASAIVLVIITLWMAAAADRRNLDDEFPCGCAWPDNVDDDVPGGGQMICMHGFAYIYRPWTDAHGTVQDGWESAGTFPWAGENT